MKKLFLLVATIIFLNNSAFSVTYNSNPKIFISELVEDAIKTLSDKSITDEEKRSTISKIALENVDINALGLYTLGNVRKTLDKDILNNYQNLFEKYFSHFQMLFLMQIYHEACL